MSSPLRDPAPIIESDHEDIEMEIPGHVKIKEQQLLVKNLKRQFQQVSDQILQLTADDLTLDTPETQALERKREVALKRLKAAETYINQAIGTDSGDKARLSRIKAITDQVRKFKNHDKAHVWFQDFELQVKSQNMKAMDEIIVAFGQLLSDRTFAPGWYNESILSFLNDVAFSLPDLKRLFLSKFQPQNVEAQLFLE